MKTITSGCLLEDNNKLQKLFYVLKRLIRNHKGFSLMLYPKLQFYHC